jgi:chemotaxis protein CheC
MADYGGSQNGSEGQASGSANGNPNDVNSPDYYDEMKIDALKEIGNIGASHASTALSNLTHQDILIDVPDCYVVKAEHIPKSFGDDLESPVVAVYFEANGKEKGHILMVLPLSMTLQLSDLLLGREPVPGREIDDMDREAMAEIGNICTSAYLSAISDFIGEILLPSPPGIAVDMLHAILQFPASLAAENYEYIVLIKTTFRYAAGSFPGFILYIPDPNSQRLLMAKFGIQ